MEAIVEDLRDTIEIRNYHALKNDAHIRGEK